ncbi:MAG: N-acyl-D-amino-acid deacylase family protein [Bacteroidota bacterium]
MRAIIILIIFLHALTSCNGQPTTYDIILRGGTVIDGSGGEPFSGDVAINGDSIAAIGDLSTSAGRLERDITGLVIAPGFINMLSWAEGSLLEDGRSMSDLKQGVTLEVFGEGWSPGPRKITPRDKRWTTLGSYFDYAMKKGVTPNIASFVGATSVRMYVLKAENRAPSAEELRQMKGLVRQAMKEGAMGLGSSLIYAPADYASTTELIELAREASSLGGRYITHMRSESDNIFPALKETFTIAREANIPAEIYHLKINHERNWNKIDTLLQRIDSAQRAGLTITANMYTYNASGTGLTARLPTWVQEGGMAAMRKRLKDPTVRKKVLDDLARGIPQKNSDPKDVLVMGFHRDSLNQLYRGKRLDEISALHGKNSDETMIDLIIADRSPHPIPCIFFLMSEDNLRRMLQLPYVSICSDGASIADESPNNAGNTHPRVYGSFARLLGKYVRDEKLMTLQEAVRRMTSLPASNLKISDRGLLKPGFFADLAIFDPQAIADRATFEDSHAYAEGMIHVFVNGVQVLENGNHTGKMPGRVIRGPGFKQPIPSTTLPAASPK